MARRPQPILPVFRRAGMCAMAGVLEANARIPSYRFRQQLWETLSGVRFRLFINEIACGVRDLDHLTVARSAWDTLQRLQFPLSVDWQTDGAALRGRPVIFYSSHPGYIEPLVCLAALHEFDPGVVATGWLENMSPAVAARIVGVWDSHEAICRHLRRLKGITRMLETAWARVLTFQIIRHLQGDISAEECARRRKAAITGIVSALSERRALLLFPSGGEAQKFWVGENTRYLEKLLRILADAGRRHTAIGDLVFVPMVKGGSLGALGRSRVMAAWHPLTLLMRLLPGPVFWVTMKEPLGLDELLFHHPDSHDAARYLMKRLTPGR